MNCLPLFANDGPYILASNQNPVNKSLQKQMIKRQQEKSYIASLMVQLQMDLTESSINYFLTRVLGDKIESAKYMLSISTEIHVYMYIQKSF